VFAEVFADARRDGPETGDGRDLALAKVVATLIGVPVDDVRKRQAVTQSWWIKVTTAVVATIAVLAVVTAFLVWEHQHGSSSINGSIYWRSLPMWPTRRHRAQLQNQCKKAFSGLSAASTVSVAPKPLYSRPSSNSAGTPVSPRGAAPPCTAGLRMSQSRRGSCRRCILADWSPTYAMQVTMLRIPCSAIAASSFRSG